MTITAVKYRRAIDGAMVEEKLMRDHSYRVKITRKLTPIIPYTPKQPQTAVADLVRAMRAKINAPRP